MTIIRIARVSLALVGLASILAPAYGVPTIVDPGFESPVSAPVQDGYTPFTEGAWLFTPGSEGGGPLIGTTKDPGTPWGFTLNIAEGTQAGMIQGGGTISQSGIVFDGVAYTLSLLAEGQDYFGTAADGNPLEIKVGSTTLTWSSSSVLTPPNTVNPPGPASFALYTSDPFTVSAGTYTLSITGTIPFGGPNDRTTYIDALSFAAATEGVPEPATLALAAVGLAGLGAVAWRRRQRISD